VVVPSAWSPPLTRVTSLLVVGVTGRRLRLTKHSQAQTEKQSDEETDMPAAQAIRYLTFLGPSMLHGDVAYLQLAKPSILEY